MGNKTIKHTPQFNLWLRSVKDPKAKAAVTSRVERLKKGLYGDCEPVGEGYSELRIHIGKGYRVYFKEVGNTIVVVLNGGHKKTQQKDIDAAKKIGKDLGL